MSKSSLLVVLIEEDGVVRSLLRRLLLEEGMSAKEFADPRAFLREIQDLSEEERKSVSLIVTECDFKSEPGFAVLDFMREFRANSDFSSVPFLILSRWELFPSTALSGLGAVAQLRKDATDVERIVTTVRQLLSDSSVFGRKEGS
jgi:DNA-binding response OmpR family regulator